MFVLHTKVQMQRHVAKISHDHHFGPSAPPLHHRYVYFHD